MSTARTRAALSVLFVAAGCTGTEVGNPFEESQLALTVQSTDAAVHVGVDSEPAAAISVTALWVSLGDLRFVSDDDCSSDRDTRVTVEGPIVAELVGQPEQLPALLPESLFCRVRVPLEPVRELGDGVPAELEGNSVLLLGERADGTPLQIRSRMRRELELRSKDEPFRLAGTMRAMILAFDAAVWLRGVDLEGAVPDAEGQILVDDMHERALLDAFEANLDVSLKLFRDLDADAALDAHDLAAELAASP